MVFGSVYSLMFIAWHFETASTPRKRERHFGTFSVHVRLVALELASLEKKKEEEERKERFRFFQIHFLGFYKAELKSEDIHLYSGGSGLSVDIHFVGFNLSIHAFSPLPMYFNHPHPYIEITTVICD